MGTSVRREKVRVDEVTVRFGHVDDAWVSYGVFR